MTYALAQIAHTDQADCTGCRRYMPPRQPGQVAACEAICEENFDRDHASVVTKRMQNDRKW